MSGGSNFDKTWFQSTVNQGAIAIAYSALEVMGRALPCSVVEVSGSLVTVKFEVQQPPFTLPNVTIPKAEGPWIRSPTQVGDFGEAVPAQTYFGAVTALGTASPASLALQGNLSTLYWLPIASADFTPPPDQNKALVQGPAGAVIQTSDGVVVLTLNETGLYLTIGGVQVFAITTDGAAFDALLSSTSDVVANAGGNDVSLLNHIHSDAGGTGDSGPPVPGT
jgi:hypothetical protein